MHMRADKCLRTWRPKPMQEVRSLTHAWAWWGDLKEKTQAKGSKCEPSSPVALGKYLAARDYGWTSANGQWAHLYALWNRESGWNPYQMNNQGSGACGIPQFLPCRYYGQTRAQIVAGLAYIKDRYGTPATADAFQRANNWY